MANRTGSGSLAGTEAAAEAPEDGPALLHTVVGHAALVGHAAPRALFPRGGIASAGDFAPVAPAGTTPVAMAVNGPGRSTPQVLDGFLQRFAHHWGRYLQCRNQPWASPGVMVRSAEGSSASSASTLRAARARKCAFSLAQHGSIGLKSGE